MRIIRFLQKPGVLLLLAGVILFASAAQENVLAEDKKAGPPPIMREAARGRIKTGAEKPLPVIRIFFYDVRSKEQLDALHAKMKKKFPRIDDSLKKSLAKEKEGVFEHYRYAVIFGHPTVIETCVPLDCEDVAERGETIINLKRHAKLSVDEEPSRELGFIVLAVPERNFTPLLKVLSGQGTAVIEPSLPDPGAETGRLRKKYRLMKDSTNMEAANLVYKLGQWCEDSGLYDRAREHYSRSLLFNPLSRRSAEALRRMTVLEKLNVLPENADEFLGRAEALMSIGRYEEALKDIEGALKLDAKNAQRARCHAMRGMFDRAQADIRSATALDARDDRLLSARALIIATEAGNEKNGKKREKMLGEALALLGQAITARPDCFEHHSDRAAVHLALGNLNYALQDCIEAFRRNPYHYLVHHTIGKYYLYAEQLLKAEESYSRAVENFPTLPYVFNERGTYRFITGDYRSAVEDFSRAVELAPDDAMAYYNRALARIVLERKDLAAQDLNKAIELVPENVLYLWERARLNYSVGDLARALEDLQAIIDSGAGNASVHYMVGLIHLHRKENAKAAGSFRKALELNPEEKLRSEIESQLKSIPN
jgi:tetratricopeptide (TPR) repeat protein